jgi:hypothetical protein
LDLLNFHPPSSFDSLCKTSNRFLLLQNLKESQY